MANLNPNRGTEMGKVRPVLILQANWLTGSQDHTVVVLPLSSKVLESAEPLRVTLEPRDRLLRRCQIVVEQPRTLDQRRIGHGPLTVLSSAEMLAVEQSLLAVLGMV